MNCIQYWSFVLLLRLHLEYADYVESRILLESQLQKFINIGRGLNKTVWLDKNAKINKDSSLNWNWKETNQIPDSFLPKNKLLYPVYAGDRNSDDEVFITNIIPKTESISDDESTLPSAFPAKDSHRVEEGNGSTG